MFRKKKKKTVVEDDDAVVEPEDLVKDLPPAPPPPKPVKKDEVQVVDLTQERLTQIVMGLEMIIERQDALFERMSRLVDLAEGEQGGEE